MLLASGTVALAASLALAPAAWAAHNIDKRRCSAPPIIDATAIYVRYVRCDTGRNVAVRWFRRDRACTVQRDCFVRAGGRLLRCRAQRGYDSGVIVFCVGRNSRQVEFAARRRAG